MEHEKENSNVYKYKDIVDSADINDQSQHAKKLMQLSTGITDEEYENLSMKDGLELQKIINSVNGLGDFQVPQQD